MFFILYLLLLEVNTELFSLFASGPLHGDQEWRRTPAEDRGALRSQERTLQTNLSTLLQNTQTQSKGLQKEPGTHKQTLFVTQS